MHRQGAEYLPNTAVNWNKEFCEEVTAAKAFNIEEMREKYLLTAKKRIEMRLKAIQQELAKRDLSAIPTRKLFEMMIKYEAALNAEIPNPRSITSGEIKDERDYRNMNPAPPVIANLYDIITRMLHR